MKFLLSRFLPVVFLFLFSINAQALPSFSRQTNQECSTCHIGSFGPQLTPYGMKFKIGGYTETNIKDAPLIPISAMLTAGFTHTNSDLPEAPKHYNRNNNTSLEELSLFVAGKLFKNIGIFAQATFDGVERQVALDTVDIRYAQDVSWFGQDMTVGVSVNNRPTSQDPFNTTPVWQFPFTGSPDAFAPGPAAAPVLNGSLDGRVFGLTGYTFLTNGLYAEFGGYLPSSKQYQMVTGAITDANDLPQGLNGFAPYWRLAYMKDYKKSMFSLGAFGMSGDTHTVSSHDRTDNFIDWGFDANYQYLGTRRHVFAAGASYLHEEYKWGGMEAEKSSATLHQVKLNTSYHFDKTYGLSIAYFNTFGSADNILYINNRPNSNGLIYQADWTPFGKESSWGAPLVNLRLGVQYTAYNKFDGLSAGSSNYDTTHVFVWTAF